MKRFPRWTLILRRTFLTVALAATGVALAYVEEDVRGHLAWKRFAEERVALGVPLDFGFYLPPRIPDEQNLFRSKNVLQLANQDTAESKKFDKDSYYIYDFWRSFGRWQEGTRADFHGAYAVLTAKEKPAPYPGDAAAAELVVRQFSGIAPQLDSFCEDAAHLPGSQVGVGRSGRMEPNIFGLVRKLSYALGWRASAEIVEGRRDDAYRDTYACIRLIEGPLSAPIPTGIGVSASVMGRSLQPLWEGCWHGTWNEAQLATFQGMLARIRPVKMLPGANAMDAAISLPDRKMPPRWAPDGWAELSAIQFVKLNANECLRCFDAATGRMNLSEWNHFDEQLPVLMRSYSPITRMAAGRIWPGQIPMVANEQATVILAETACALERFRLRSGRYPDSLAELVPALMGTVPTDIIDGAPLRYRVRENGRYLLYSIGLNGIDDHGAIPSSSKGYKAPWYISPVGDWVWPEPKS